MAYQNSITHTLTTDVLVVGGGTAGTVASIEARVYGLDVILVDKGRFGFSGSTCTSDGETSAIFHEEDTPEKFLEETIKGGEYVNINELTETLIYQSNEAVLKLKDYGVPFVMSDNGRLQLYKELGMNYPRTPKVKGGGPAFMTALCKEALFRGVRLLERVMIFEVLFGSNGTPSGCLGINVVTGEVFLIKAKTIILAAGSATKLYPYSSANFLTTGDGYWLGYEAGLEFVNMEFPEFTIIPAPGGTPLHTGGIKPLTGRGARFLNRNGERFMEKLDPVRKELVKRAKLVQALYNEINDGRGPVYMDMTHFPEDEFLHMENVLQQGIIKKLKEIGVNYRENKFQWISPAVHTFLGGVRINKDGETNLPGLYAVGENAGGIYGADRVGTYLTACTLFGYRTGRVAAKYAAANSQEDIVNLDLEVKMEKLTQIASSNGDIQAAEIETAIRKVAGDYLSLGRHEAGLVKALAKMNHINNLLDKTQINGVQDIVRTLENRNMALTGKLVGEAALFRKETRGQHTRSDYPKLDASAQYLTSNSKKGIDCIKNQ